jgi:predicted Zn-dependent protease
MRKYFFFQSQAAIAAAEDEYPIAISLHRRSLEITRQNNMSSLYVASVYNEMGRCFLKSNKPDSAITYLKRNCGLCKKTELNKFLMDAYKMLATAYEDKGDKENKLEYQNLYLSFVGFYI